MTIQVKTSTVTYIGDGSQVTYAIDYRFFSDDNLKIYFDGVLQASGYTVQNSNAETGSSVTFATAPANQVVIAIERVLEYQQLLDLIEYDDFPAESVESQLDYIVLLTQQNAAALGRSLNAAPGVPEDVDLTVPAPGADEFFKYASDGKSIETANIFNLGENIIPAASDGEITAGTETDPRLVSPAQVKLGVETHETADITSIFNVSWVEVVDVLPGTPDANKMYLARQ